MPKKFLYLWVVFPKDFFSGVVLLVVSQESCTYGKYFIDSCNGGLSTADNVPRASSKTGTKDSRDEYGTDAKKKTDPATVAEAEVQLLLGVPATVTRFRGAAKT